MKIYLLGGFDIRRGDASPVDQRYMREAEPKSVYVLDLAPGEGAKRLKYRALMAHYFGRLGAAEVDFASIALSKAQIGDRIASAGVVYLPGGYTPGLVGGLYEHGVEVHLRQAPRIVAGNSAGAIACCRDALLNTAPDEDDPYVLAGVGLVGFSIDPHYNLSHDAKLLRMSQGRTIYGLPEESAIAYDGSVEFIGPVWSFAEGEKTQVN